MNKEFFTTLPIRILIVFILLMVLFALGSYASLNYEKIKYVDGSQTIISVTGEGEVVAVPNIGQFSFNVTFDAIEATIAQEESAIKMNQIIAYLKSEGIEEKDIKTTSYNLYPKYRWEERLCPMGSFCPPGEQVQDGFSVSQGVVVKVRDVNLAGKLLAGVGERGASDISSLSFTVDDPDMLEAEARNKAIEDAQKKATLLAKQLGVRIVRLTFYSEAESEFLPYQTMRMATDQLSNTKEVPELPVGEESFTVRVDLNYEVR